MSQRAAVAAAFFLSLAVLLAGASVRGMYMGDNAYAYFNDTNSYLHAGDRIIAWLLAGASEELGGSSRFPFYVIPSVLLSGIHDALEAGAAGVIVLNAVLFSITVSLAVWFWTTVHGTWDEAWSRRGFFMAAAGGLYIMFGLPDAFLWSYAILTDIIFTFWVSVFVVAVAGAIVKGGRFLWIVALIAALTAPFVRPTGFLLPLLLVYAAALVWVYRKGTSVKVASLVSIGVATVLAFVIFPGVVLLAMKKYWLIKSLAPDPLDDYLAWTVSFFRHGIVVKTRVELLLDSPPSYLEIIRIMLHRLLYYWVPIRFGDRPYSMMHNVVNAVYIVAVLPLFFVGATRLFQDGRTIALAALFLLMVGYAFALMHAMTLVGFDWRYQVPAMVPFWLFAGCGLYSLLGRAARSRTPASLPPHAPR